MSNIFDVLKDYHTIIAYEENMEEINEFIKYSPSKICYLKLSKYPELKEKFIKKYQIKELPCMISFGNLVYLNENLEKDLLVVKEKEKNFYFGFISNLKNKNKIFIFIKGSVKEPKCKFTRRLLEIFNELNLVYEKDYDYFDILSDEKMRELCKEYNNWQTFPQIFIKGNFYGGLDVLINGVKDKTIFDLIK